MADYIELDLEGAALRVELADVGERDEEEWAPVSSRGGRIARMASDAFRETLRPLGPVLQQVHDAVKAAPNPPHELSVELGVEIGQDLKLGIVGGHGQATMKITASWRMDDARGA